MAASWQAPTRARSSTRVRIVTHSGVARGIPRGVQEVTIAYRQVVRLQVRVRRLPEFAAEDGDLAESLERPAGTDRGQALRSVEGGVRGGVGCLHVAPVHGSKAAEASASGRNGERDPAAAAALTSAQRNTSDWQRHSADQCS